MAVTFSGVWEHGSGSHFLLIDADWTNFKAKYQELVAGPLRLQGLRTYVCDGVQCWAGGWREHAGTPFLFAEADWEHFKVKYSELADQGFRLRAFDGIDTDGTPKWAGVWEQAAGAHRLHVDADWSHFKAVYQDLANQGLRLVAFRTYQRGGDRLWAGAFRESSVRHYLHVDADQASFLAVHRQRVADGLGLAAIASYQLEGTEVFAGAWREDATGIEIELNRDWADFKARYEALAQQGMRLSAFDIAGTAGQRMLKMHIKVLTDPQRFSLDTMLGRMRQVYATVGIAVEVGSVERISSAALNDLEVGPCVRGEITREQARLFSNRNGVGPNEIVVYFVRSTVPPLNGCAAHGSLPSAVVASLATAWTLAHEVGHVLSLAHVGDNRRLMTGNGTVNIIGPPQLIEAEQRKMFASPFLQS